MRPKIGYLIIVTIVLLLMEGCYAKDGGEFHIIDTGQKAPHISLPGMDGNIVSLDRYKKDVIVLVFWATWCKNCKKEMPLLEEIYNRYRDKGLTIIGVNYNEGKEKVEKFVSEMGLTFPMALDNDLKVTRAYQVLSLPTIFFVDRKGFIRDRYRGEIGEEFMLSKVDPLIEESG